MYIDFGYLILGHLWGDYLFQTDAMAQNKGHNHRWAAFHAAVYTFAVFLAARAMFTHSLLFGLVALLVIFGTHFVQDRYRLARRMMTYTGQETFATGSLAPWSVIVVDNVMHVTVLYVLYNIFVHYIVMP